MGAVPGYEPLAGGVDSSQDPLPDPIDGLLDSDLAFLQQLLGGSFGSTAADRNSTGTQNSVDNSIAPSQAASCNCATPYVKHENSQCKANEAERMGSIKKHGSSWARESDKHSGLESGKHINIIMRKYVLMK